MDKSKYSKEFKKICDKTIAATKDEVRNAQIYSKLWSKYSSIRDKLNESSKKLNSVSLILQKKAETVETLRQLDRERQDELEKVRNDIKELHEKIAKARQNELQGKNKETQMQLLNMTLLKRCTRTYIDDKSLPFAIRGFAANEQQSKVIPFEIDAANMTESDVQKALWEICYSSSGYVNEWNHLFFEENLQ